MLCIFMHSYLPTLLFLHSCITLILLEMRGTIMKTNKCITNNIQTTLLKAEGARHVKQGGLVFYVCAPPKGHGSSWQHLSYAVQNAAESKIPALVLVEDFEMFVSDAHELQLVLNVLDGVAAPA